MFLFYSYILSREKSAENILRAIDLRIQAVKKAHADNKHNKEVHDNLVGKIREEVKASASNRGSTHDSHHISGFDPMEGEESGFSLNPNRERRGKR